MKWLPLVFGASLALPVPCALAQSAEGLGAPRPGVSVSPGASSPTRPTPPPPVASSAPPSAASTSRAPAASASRTSPGPERAFGLATPRPGVRPRAWRLGAAPRRPPSHHAPAAPAAGWNGPRVELGWAHYTLTDGYGGGTVNAFDFGGYIPFGWLRLGGYAELGSRSYQLGDGDAVVRGNLLVGYQYLRRLAPMVPYAAVVGTLGVVIGKRFHTPLSYDMGGLGIEVGADFNLVRSLWVGIGLSYLRAAMQGLAYDILTLRLRIGL